MESFDGSQRPARLLLCYARPKADESGCLALIHYIVHSLRVAGARSPALQALGRPKVSWVPMPITGERRL